MDWKKFLSKDDNIIGVIATLALTPIIVAAIIGSPNNRKNKSNHNKAHVENYIPMENQAGPLGNITYDDLMNRLPKKTHYELQIITEAEDEYWEIEKVNGNYYRVRREDYYPGEERIEFDTEEPIGDIDQLIKYAKNKDYLSGF